MYITFELYVSNIVAYCYDVITRQDTHLFCDTINYNKTPDWFNEWCKLFKANQVVHLMGLRHRKLPSVQSASRLINCVQQFINYCGSRS